MNGGPTIVLYDGNRVVIVSDYHVMESIDSSVEYRAWRMADAVERFGERLRFALRHDMDFA